MNYICTSFCCNGPAGKLGHCPDCTHLVVLDQVTTKGKVYKFEFTPRFGFLVAKPGCEECDWQPGAKHPVWKDLAEWQHKLDRCLKTRISVHTAKCIREKTKD